MTKAPADSSDSRQRDGNPAPVLVLKVIGWCLSLWTLPLVLVGSFVGPHILFGAALSGFAAAISFVLANRLSAGREWSRWGVRLFGTLAIGVQTFACVEMVKMNEPLGAFVFPIVGIVVFAYLLYAVSIEANWKRKQ